MSKCYLCHMAGHRGTEIVLGFLHCFHPSSQVFQVDSLKQLTADEVNHVVFNPVLLVVFFIGKFEDLAVNLDAGVRVYL